MARKVYALEVIKDETVPNNIQDFLWDEEHFLFTKKDWLRKAQDLTRKVNSLFNVNYTYNDLFGEFLDVGLAYCQYCDCIFYIDDCCECI